MKIFSMPDGTFYNTSLAYGRKCLILRAEFKNEVFGIKFLSELVKRIAQFWFLFQKFRDLEWKVYTDL